MVEWTRLPLKPSRLWNLTDISTFIQPDEIVPTSSDIVPSRCRPDVKRASVLTTQVQTPPAPPPPPSVLECMEYLSCWHRAKKAVAVCLCIQEQFGSRTPGVKDTTARYLTGSQKTKYIPVNVQELQTAENEIIKNV